MKTGKEKHFDIQNKALRDPLQIVSSTFADACITASSLKFSVEGDFLNILNKLKITLFVTREYEHLLIALNSENGRIRQSFFPLPHPSGIIADRTNNSVYVVSSRNPNQIIEFKPVKKFTERKDNRQNLHHEHILIPSRVKYYPGSYYFHDLAIINRKLYANSVGRNGIIEVDFTTSSPEELMWWPKIVEKQNGKPDIRANYIQLNSIAGGATIEKSFFTASGNSILKHRPGDLNYPVNKTGVVLSGKKGDVIAGGLTRPHSAKIYKNKIWLNNSGYGQMGYIESGKFVPVIKLPGWTRGLCIHKDIAFVGVSRVLPRFKHYAPGLNNNKQTCALYAISLKNIKVLGCIKWNNGNQIFGIDFININISSGFLYTKVRPSTIKEKSVFYKYHC